MFFEKHANCDGKLSKDTVHGILNRLFLLWLNQRCDNSRNESKFSIVTDMFVSFDKAMFGSLDPAIESRYIDIGKTSSAQMVVFLQPLMDGLF